MSEASPKRTSGARARSSRARQAPGAVWRDGIQLTDTPIWCDARRRRDVCFASAYGRVGRAGHGQLIATPATLAMLGASGPGHLGVPLRRKFSLGQLQLELLPSGVGLGAAALRVEAQGKTTLYAGAVSTRSAGVFEAGEVRAADCVVVAAPYGAPAHAFADPAMIAAQLVEWVQAQAARGFVLVLVSTELRALELATLLGRTGLELCAPPALRNLARRARAAAPALPELRNLARERPAVVLATTEMRESVVRRLGAAPLVTAWVSGEAADPGALSRAAVDRGFAWSSCADRAQLLSWIEATAAREIYVTGRHAAEVVEHLGPRAAVLGPPLQMRLFTG